MAEKKAGQAELLQIFPFHVREILMKTADDWEEVQELRLRSQKPLFITVKGQEYAVGKEGGLLSVSSADRLKENRSAVCMISQKDIEQTVECAARHSLYAFEEQIRQGFLTVAGGHRIGVIGKAVLERREIRTIKPIAGLNIRIAHEKKGCSDRILHFLADPAQGEWLSTLLVSPPCCGKTTLLRDIVRNISDGCGYMEGGLLSGSSPERCGDPQRRAGRLSKGRRHDDADSLHVSQSGGGGRNRGKRRFGGHSVCGRLRVQPDCCGPRLFHGGTGRQAHVPGTVSPADFPQICIFEQKKRTWYGRENFRP